MSAGEKRFCLWLGRLGKIFDCFYFVSSSSKTVFLQVLSFSGSDRVYGLLSSNSAFWIGKNYFFVPRLSQGSFGPLLVFLDLLESTDFSRRKVLSGYGKSYFRPSALSGLFWGSLGFSGSDLVCLGAVLGRFGVVLSFLGAVLGRLAVSFELS